LLLVSATAAFAQTTTAPTPAPAVSEPAPQITELERTKLENLQLKFQMLQQQQQQLQQSYSDLIRQISAEHPGYTFDPQTSSLRRIPPVASAPAKPTPAVKH
jgi:hypothetical protein